MYVEEEDCATGRVYTGLAFTPPKVDDRSEAEKEAMIRLYTERATAGLDIFTGKPR